MIPLNVDFYTKTNKYAFTATGFRPFFLGAGIFASLAMLLWLLSYIYGIDIVPQPAIRWHAHEMIFGYTMAVVAGFLLTAVRNWTKIQTLDGKKLSFIFGAWALARIAPFIPWEHSLLLQYVLESIFLLGFFTAIMIPIIKRKLITNYPVGAIGLAMFVANTLYHYGLYNTDYIHLNQFGVYIGFYIVMTLIMVFSRRLIPNFMRGATGRQEALYDNDLLDTAFIPLFIIFGVLQVWGGSSMHQLLAIVLFLLGSVRLYFWYDKRMWTMPLLWSLYLSWAMIVLSFGLMAMTLITGTAIIALHGFAVGGLGLVTASMMSRVSIGHTGRSIFSPPALIKYAFVALLIAMVFRAVLPLFFSNYYLLFVEIAMYCWIIAFVLFTILFTKILVAPRADGRHG